MAEKAFDPADNFDAATEVLRKDIAAAIANHWMVSPAAQCLEDEAKFQSICVALTVSLAASIKSLTDLTDKEAIIMVKKSLPAAFKTAAEIMASVESDGETKH